MEILRHGCEYTQPTAVNGVFHFEFHGVQQRIRQSAKAFVLDYFGPILHVADDWVACHRQVAADLVGASSFDTDC